MLYIIIGMDLKASPVSTSTALLMSITSRSTAMTSASSTTAIPR